MQINVGCGQSPTEGWVNFDNSFAIRLSAWPALAKLLKRLNIVDQRQMEFIEFAAGANIRYADVVKGLPLKDESVSVFYSSHVLEHLDRSDAEIFLKEVLRVLRPNGIIRLAVPDIEKQVSRYLFEKDADAFVSSTLMCVPRHRGVAGKLRMLIIGPRNHLWGYDGRSLCKLLERIGFKDVVELLPGETTIVKPGKLDLYERAGESVYVEARKEA